MWQISKKHLYQKETNEINYDFQNYIELINKLQDT
jgi:hypothetical protein